MDDRHHRAFLSSNRPHILMVTNHGLHEWNISAGLPDTGGQNVYVNQLSGAFASLGFRVTTANRGGYSHPRTGTRRTGTSYRGSFERIIYLEDGVDEFVRKEDMEDLVPLLGRHLGEWIREEGDTVDAILSHYWDSALVAHVARGILGSAAPHIWFPHSLGRLKAHHTPEDQWESIRIGPRIQTEQHILQVVDTVSCTSQAMAQSLREEYRWGGTSVFLPPCVDTRRFNPEVAVTDRRAVALLSHTTGRSVSDVISGPIITEISRTDRTKNKPLLIHAFAKLRNDHPDAILAVSIDKSNPALYTECDSLIDELGLRGSVAVLGSVWEYIPSLYGMTTVYCTPSTMEGFGMSIQEAAACGVASVASSCVPFAVEHLCGETPRLIERPEDGSIMKIGEGAIIVDPDNAGVIAQALKLLLEEPDLRRKMGDRALHITVPRFTWKTATLQFLADAGIRVPGGSHS